MVQSQILAAPLDNHKISVHPHAAIYQEIKILVNWYNAIAVHFGINLSQIVREFSSQ
ncbi:MAG: hypothetical protein ICV54_10920 [Nostoc sp. C3-bin3]|nr:hypothetical protein [Nostoc sp. C3-bin3]